MITMINKTWFIHVLGYMPPSLSISLRSISRTVYKIGLGQGLFTQINHISASVTHTIINFSGINLYE